MIPLYELLALALSGNSRLEELITWREIDVISLILIYGISYFQMKNEKVAKSCIYLTKVAQKLHLQLNLLKVALTSKSCKKLHL